MHAFYVHDSPRRLELDEFAGEVEPTAFAVDPFVPDLALGFCLADTHRHGPAFRTQHPFLDQFRVGVRPIPCLGRRTKSPRDANVAIAFSLPSHLAHRFLLPFRGFFSPTPPSRP